MNTNSNIQIKSEKQNIHKFGLDKAKLLDIFDI